MKKRIVLVLLLSCVGWPPGLAAMESSATVGLDVNRDGLIQLRADPRIPVDRTTPATPFLFWVNADQDDLESYESWPIERPDHSTPVIDSERDIEDLYPIWIDLGPHDLPADSVVTFRWHHIEQQAPAINLFASADPTCNNQQLLDAQAAAQQISGAYAQTLGTVKPDVALQIASRRIGAPQESDRGRGLCLLMEGAATGTGQLHVSVDDASGNAYSRGTIHLSLRPVKAFYQRTRIDWPDHINAPWTYAPDQPPDPQLQWVNDPQGVNFDAPWYEDEHILVWVYGWQTEGDTGYLSATVKGGETIFKRLWHRGFKGRLVFLHWPTVKPRLAYGLFQSEYRAYKAGPALKHLVETQPQGRLVHVTAHSLGNVILTEALRLGMQAEDAMFQVGAVSAGAIDPREELTLPETRDLETPDFADEFGYRGYLGSPRTRLYNMYNPFDHTWIGWNLAQHLMKPTHEEGARYEYVPEAEAAERYVLRYQQGDKDEWHTRPVTDRHEIMAFIARSKTHPIGGEARAGGPILHAFDVGRPPYSFGHGHTVGWIWSAQRTVRFFNLLLDAFNIAHKSPHR